LVERGGSGWWRVVGLERGGSACVSVCVCVSVRACVHACVCARALACECMDVWEAPERSA
jgi:hypothetical protein